MTEVAILVAAYNAATTLPRCLDSLCSQTLTAIEILCVDDCSTDNTFSLLRQRATADSRIYVLQTPRNSGQAVARNLALQHVRAPYVCMVDADDWLAPDALEQAMAVFRAHPLTDCCVFRLVLHKAADDSECDYGLPQPLAEGSALTGQEAFELCLDGWKLHGLYLTRTRLHRQYPFDTATRLYSDDNASRLHYLHSREVRACGGTYYYYRHPAATTDVTHFSIHRFDIMEANLSLLIALKKEPIRPQVLRRYEGSRWMTFIYCYRLFLQHLAEMDDATSTQIAERLHTILHTFRPSRLSLRYRWKPGYWLTLNDTFFRLQQKTYLHLWEHGIKTFRPFK